MLRRLFLIRQSLFMIFRRTIHRIQSVAQNKFVLLKLLRRNPRSIPQRQQLRLELRVRINHQFQRLANIILPVNIGIDVVVQLVIDQQKVIQLVMRLLRAFLVLGSARISSIPTSRARANFT